ncbi:MAG: DUF58 domain-containing protein [Planctomycetaceae bacterium]|nr:DUF58 domain-containing protein [Planctomycetaceae bacterium]
MKRKTKRLSEGHLAFRLTPAGRVCFFLIGISGLGSVTVQLPVYQFFCVLTCVVLFAEALGQLFRPKLSAVLTMPSSIQMGQTVCGTLTIKNIGRWPVFDIMAMFHGLPRPIKHANKHEMIPSIRAGESAELPVTLSTSTRGIYDLPPLRIHSTFPFNLMRFGKCTALAQPLHVLPDFHMIPELNIPTGSRHQPGGMLLQKHDGNSPEFVGNREYSYGEPASRINFRAWARLGRPVVREYMDEFCMRVAIVLDTRVTPTSRWNPLKIPNAASNKNLEAAICFVASLAASMQTAESLLDMFAAGPELHVFRGATGAYHFDRLLEILAGIGSTTTNPLPELTPAVTEELQSISTVFCVFLHWDLERQTLVDGIHAAGCEFRVVLVNESESELPFPEDGVQFIRMAPDTIVNGEVLKL